MGWSSVNTEQGSDAALHRRSAPSSIVSCVVIAVQVLVGVLTLSSCGVGRAAEPGAHSTAIVVASYANELAPTLGRADLDDLRAAAADPDTDDVVAYVVAAGRPDIETVDLEPRRPNGQVERGPGIDRLVARRLTELQHAITRGAERGTDTDLLGALATAVRTGAARILVLSSGISTTDPLDMRVSGWDRDSADLARDLRRRRLLPDLSGRVVIFSGLSRTAGAQRPLGIREQAELRDQWLAICAAAGGICRADDSVRPAMPPVSRLTPAVVAVPAITTTPGPRGAVTVSVPSPLLFAPDSCKLVDQTAAGRMLKALAVRLRSGRYTVSISGRTAPVGPGDGVRLATCRAHAAADLLRALGVPATAITKVRGDGSRLDLPSASHHADGRLDRSKLAALRRVVFTVIPSKES